jgi:uncharacterized protein YlaI
LKNEFGEPLDRNGYAPSIIPWAQDVCIICQRHNDICYPLQRHEIFHGSLYRERSKNLGLWVHLCPECHRRLHNTTPAMDKFLKREGQKEAMWRYHWNLDEFRKHFGKNYLGVDE